MEYLSLFLYLLFTGVISFLNNYGGGAIKSEARAIGGWTRIVNVSSLIMAGIGWTWIDLTLIALVLVAFGQLTYLQAEALMGIGYIIIWIPLIGSGLVIMTHTIMRFWKSHRFGDAIQAGWNVYANAHNIYQGVKEMPNIFDRIITAFADEESDDKSKALIILAVIVALAGGIITTVLIADWADKKHVISLEEVKRIY